MDKSLKQKMASAKRKSLVPVPPEYMEIFTCSLCEELLQEPKDTPCKHSFCLNCLQQYCLLNATNTGYPCPECHKEVKVKDTLRPILEWASELKTDDVTKKKLEKMLVIAKDKNKKYCSFCAIKFKSVVGTKYCKSCAEYYCDECGNQHWLLRASKEHRVWLIDDIRMLKTDSLLRSSLELLFNAKVKEPKRKETHKLRGLVKSDEFNVEISDATFLSNGCIVLADKGNGRLKFYDQYHTFVNAYNANCHGVLALSENYLVVTCPNDTCIRSISVFQHMFVEEDEIATASECYGICLLEKYKYAVIMATKPVKILLFYWLDNVESIEVESGNIPMLCPKYIAYSKNLDLFYLSDPIHSCLKCVSKNGNIEWEKKLEGCNDLVAFEDNLLIARKDRHTVDLINSKGRIEKSVITTIDGLSEVHTLCLDYWNQSSKIAKLLVADATDLVRIFRIEDPQQDSDIRRFINASPYTESEISMDRRSTSKALSNDRYTCTLI